MDATWRSSRCSSKAVPTRLKRASVRPSSAPSIRVGYRGEVTYSYRQYVGVLADGSLGWETTQAELVRRDEALRKSTHGLEPPCGTPSSAWQLLSAEPAPARVDAYAVEGAPASSAVASARPSTTARPARAAGGSPTAAHAPAFRGRKLNTFRVELAACSASAEAPLPTSEPQSQSRSQQQQLHGWKLTLSAQAARASALGSGAAPAHTTPRNRALSAARSVAAIRSGGGGGGGVGGVGAGGSDEVDQARSGRRRAHSGESAPRLEAARREEEAQGAEMSASRALLFQGAGAGQFRVVPRRERPASAGLGARALDARSRAAAVAETRALQDNGGPTHAHSRAAALAETLALQGVGGVARAHGERPLTPSLHLRRSPYSWSYALVLDDGDGNGAAPAPRSGLDASHPMHNPPCQTAALPRSAHAAEGRQRAATSPLRSCTVRLRPHSASCAAGALSAARGVAAAGESQGAAPRPTTAEPRSAAAVVAAAELAASLPGGDSGEAWIEYCRFRHRARLEAIVAGAEPGDAPSP
jgi:hypothetical protein